MKPKPVIVTVQSCEQKTHVVCVRLSETSQIATARTILQPMSAFQAIREAPGSTGTVDLDRTPNLAGRVLKRLESVCQPTSLALRPDQQSIALELLENGRSVEEVARAFNVAEVVVRALAG